MDSVKTVSQKQNSPSCRKEDFKQRLFTRRRLGRQSDPCAKPTRKLRLGRAFPDQTILWERRSSDSGLRPRKAGAASGTKSSALPVVVAAEEFSSPTATVWSPNASCQFPSRGTLLTFRSPPARVGPSWPGPLTPEERRPPWSGSTPSPPTENPDASQVTAGPRPRWPHQPTRAHVAPGHPGQAARAEGEHRGQGQTKAAGNRLHELERGLGSGGRTGQAGPSLLIRRVPSCAKRSRPSPPRTPRPSQGQNCRCFRFVTGEAVTRQVR